MNALLWAVRHWVRRLGPAGCAAGVLLAGSAALYWGGTVPGWTNLRAAQEQFTQEQARTGQARRAAAGRGGERARLATLLARFPVAGNSAANAAVAAIAAQADANRLVLASASYQLSADSAGAFERYVISLPLKGRYPDVRAFLTQVRAGTPHLALDSVSLARVTKEDPVIEAQLQFTAYFRGRP